MKQSQGKLDLKALEEAVDIYMLQNSEELIKVAKSGSFRLTKEAREEVLGGYGLGDGERSKVLGKAENGKYETPEEKRIRLLEKKEKLKAINTSRKLEKIKNQTFEQRKLELGKDPVKGYIDHEGEVGAKIEKQYGYLERANNPDVEWVSLSGLHKGKSLDLIGLEPGINNYVPDDMKDFIKSLKVHINKADIVILDYRYMNKNQINSVEHYLNSNGISDNNLRKIWNENDL